MLETKVLLANAFIKHLKFIFRFIRRILPVQFVTSASITELEKGLRKLEIDKNNIKTVNKPK